MWRPAYKDRLDSNDRKKIRRIFYQMVGLYMSLVVIVIAGVVVRSVFTTLPEISFRQNSICTEFSVRAPIALEIPRAVCSAIRRNACETIC